MIFTKELKKLGLKDKEASVYLACLELGPSPVQVISRKAKVVRATTYVVLEVLMNYGLVTKYKEGKKTLFSAEPPRQLTRLLEKRREEIDEKKHDLDQILPELQVLMKSAGGRPSVRYFTGKEGLHVIRQEILMYSNYGDIIYNFTPADYVNALFPANEETFHKQRSAKKIKARTIFTTRSETLKRTLFSRSPEDLNERRFIDPKHFPFSSGISIFRDRFAIGNFAGNKAMGVIIENESMADAMTAIHKLAWVGAEYIDND